MVNLSIMEERFLENQSLENFLGMTEEYLNMIRLTESHQSAEKVSQLVEKYREDEEIQRKDLEETARSISSIET